MKLLIITADKTFSGWKTKQNKLKTIKDELKETGDNWTVTYEYRDIIPVVNAGRITHNWFDDLKSTYKGYDLVGFHFSDKQRKKWGIKPSLRGSTHKDNDYTGEFWFWANEHTKRGRYNQFIEVCLHEIRHELVKWANMLDDTHVLHDKHGTIRGQFKQINLKGYVAKKTSLIDQIKALIAKLTPQPALLPLVEDMAQAVVDEMELLGHPVRIVEGFRSIAKQNELYAQGRTKPGAIVTNAKGGESLHNYGVAVDFVFRKEGYNASKELWETLGKTGEKYGFEWGGRWSGFTDRPHLQLTLGYTLEDFKNKRVDYNKYI